MALDMTQPLYDSYEQSCDEATAKHEKSLEDFTCDVQYSISTLKRFNLDAGTLDYIGRAMIDIQELREAYPEMDIHDSELLNIIQKGLK